MLPRSSLRLALLCSLPLCLAPSGASAQQLTVTPYHANGIYDVNETVGWRVALPKGGAAPAGAYTYTARKNNFGDPVKTGTLDLSGGSATIEVTADEPAMLFVRVTPPAGAGRGTALGAALAPSGLQPPGPRPADFDAFWDGKLRELAKIPVNPVLTRGESGRPGVEFATVKVDSLGSSLQGCFAKPAREGKYPAIVLFQWAGVYALPKNAVVDRAAQGWLALNVDAHDKPPGSATGPPQNYQGVGNTDREKAYFLRMYLRDVRAIDYLASRPEWDGKTLVVMGTSMGGQQSLCAAGLSPKVTHVIVNEPSGCDMCGPLHGRAFGYPNWPADDKAVMRTAPYFDAVHFAPRIKAAALMGIGFVDTAAPPAGNWIAFSRIKGPKEAAPMPDSPHNNLATARQQLPFTRRSAEWLNALVKGGAVNHDGEAARPKKTSPTKPPPAATPVARTDANSRTAHEQFLEKAKKGRIDVYFAGDSITRRWGATDYPGFLANWRQNFHGRNAANFGWGGDTVQNVLWRLHNGELDGVNPKVIVVMAGTNNIGTAVPAGGDEAKLAEIVGGLEAVLGVCREKAPGAVVVLMGITPRNDIPAAMAITNQVNEQVARLADGRKVRYLNINDKLADKDGRLLEGMSPDRLHLSAKGYQVWADALKPVLAELLGPPAKEDLAPPPTGDPGAAKKK